jgi:hypothetical protein
MGINIYARYRGEDPWFVHHHGDPMDESISGYFGWLHESSHPWVYVTYVLCTEAFRTGYAAIPAATLRERLPTARRLIEERERLSNPSVSQDEIEYVYAKFVGFVEYCERAEAKLGEPVPIRMVD